MIRTAKVFTLRFYSQRPQRVALGCAHGPSLLETFAAENRATLRGTEGNGGFLAALRTTGFGFRAHRTTAPGRFRALGLAGLAALGLVFESLVGEEHLFAAGKYKLGATLRAL